MKRIIFGLILAGLLIEDPFSFWNPNGNLWAQENIRFSLQVASCSTLAAAQKEIDRLKTAHIQARYTIREDKTNRKWFVIYIDRYKTKEEATLRGKQLIQKGIIQNFKIFPQKSKEEGPPQAKEFSATPSLPSKKEPKPPVEKNPVYFGPIVIKEEENALRIHIMLDRKIFPEITADKIADGSRLIVTFNNIDRYIVPFEFDKVQSRMLLSFHLSKKGLDCTFVLLLHPAYNYEVSQDYFEKEKMYSLVIRRGPAAEPNKTVKE